MSRQSALLGAMLAFMAGAAEAQNPLQGEVSLKAATKIERDAGVWLDGQYVGFVGDLRGRNRLVLVPGPHELLIKLVGFQDLSLPVAVEPGQNARLPVSMEPDPDARYPAKDSVAQVHIDVAPENAAVFVDNSFAGHVDRFNGRRSMRIAPGTYRFTVALPGYESFQTEMTLRENQTYKIETELPRGDLADQAAELIALNPGAVATESHQER